MRHPFGCHHLPRLMATVLLVANCAIAAVAEEPLHVRIDALIDAQAAKITKTPATAELSTDAEFYRRVWLDLTGRIPTADDTRTFIADKSATKRPALIDRLLNSPDYPRRMREAFHVMLMERRGEDADWTRFLQTSFESNKPWDQLTREIAHPDAENEQTRGSAFFLTKRLEKYGQNPTDHPGLARDFGRMFLGMDLQCAQCHNHLFIDDYKQADFQGMFAFVKHTFIRRDTKFPAIGEGLIKANLEFVSVFGSDQMKTGPRLPGGAEFPVPVLKKGEEYSKLPDRKIQFPGVPKFSPLTILAEELPKAGNPAFAKNIANRLWFLMMGRGLVTPLDLHHSQNPPSHPELLELLAQEIAKHKFDMKWFVRELALTQTYQRSGLLPDSVEKLPEETFLVAIEKPLSAEQLLWSMLQATGQYDAIVVAKARKSKTTTQVGDKAAASAAAAASTGDSVNELLTKFRTAFANAPREPEVDFSPSVKAALFVLNDATVFGWLSPQSDSLVGRLSKVSESKQVIVDIYLSVLSRQPTDEEVAAAIAYLDSQPQQRAKAVGHLVWALMASTEFCINH